MLEADLEREGAIDDPNSEELAMIADRWRAKRDRADRDRLIALLRLPAIRACRRYKWHNEWQSETLLALVEFVEAWDGVGAIGDEAVKYVQSRVQRYLEWDKVVRVRRPWSSAAGEYCPKRVEVEHVEHPVEHPDTRLDVLDVLGPTEVELDLLDRLAAGQTYREISPEIGRSLGWIAKRVKIFQNRVNTSGCFQPLYNRDRILASREERSVDLNCKYLHMTEVPDYLMSRGIRASEHALDRWVRTGIRGVRLKTYKLGGRVCTTEASIREFFEKSA